ncbi:MAG TPA: translation elongation factor Ts [Candidatus Manganitrophaceae bacterium]|nr:translation elongation factor Ts [Candidatus Manganitrophaceae bacterium]
MSAVDTIKELREKTGAGIMDCKTALAQSQGDLAKAIDFLRQKGLATAAKKAGREAREGVIGSYIHFGGKIGVLVEVNCETDFVARNPEFQELVKDVAMQVAGSTPAPRYIRPEDVPADVIEKERAIFIAQARETKKPEAVIEKIAQGKVEKFLQEVCLMEQPFIKDPQVKIKDLIAQKISKIGENIQVRRFTRYQLGEEI